MLSKEEAARIIEILKSQNIKLCYVSMSWSGGMAPSTEVGATYPDAQAIQILMNASRT